MGMVSRQLFPVCESLCFFCPTLRARSRHPVKRYRKLLADIYLRSQDEEPNDRKIGKLCEYASKNPLRIPKITSSLEEKCCKDLRSENFHSVKVVMCIYGKLLLSCKEQIPLFASSILSVIHILLDQTRHDEMKMLGCHALFDFVNNQSDSTYMFNLDGTIPKLCLLAQAIGEGKGVEQLRSASLRALSSMVWFMGEFSYISSEFDNVVSVVLDNFQGHQNDTNAHIYDKKGSKNEYFEEPSSTEPINEISSRRMIVSVKGEVNVSTEDKNSPKFWSMVCLHNIAMLAKEATTVRRVSESFFRVFDNNNLWSPLHGLALPVLEDMQLIMENFGQNTHFLLSILIKHLDHKNVLKNPNMQLDIVDVVTLLAQQTKVQPSVAIIGALSDMMRHLRKSIHCSLGDSNLGIEVINWNQKYQEAVDECLVQLTHKVGDAGPVLDIMAVMLENMSNITVMAKTLVSVVYRTAQIVASIPNLSYENKTFPEALFHQLLVAMACSNSEARVGAHRIFSVVLVPSSVCPRPCPIASNFTKTNDIQRTLSRTVSVFSSSAALYEKLRKQQLPSQGNIYKDNNGDSIMNRLKSTYSRYYSVKREPSIAFRGDLISKDNTNMKSPSLMNRLKSGYNRTYTIKGHQSCASSDEKATRISGKVVTMSLRLSSRQITLLLSSIWAQSISPLNTPENYEAIAHTYSLVLLYARCKNTSHETLVQSFQLAFSLRSRSLGEEGSLRPSHRRSLFTLATAMIIFASRAYNILRVVPCAKAALTNEIVDPFLQLVDDCKLQVVDTGEKLSTKSYGSKEDEEDATKSLSTILITESQSKESFVDMIVQTLEKTSKESTRIKRKLLDDFVPDDVCPMGDQFLETPGHIYQSELKSTGFCDKVEPLLFIIEDDVLSNPSAIQSGLDSKQVQESPSLLSIDELLDLVVLTKHQVGRLSVSTPYDMPYKEMAGQCEALRVGKEEKMSTFMAAQQMQASLISISSPDYNQEKDVPSSFSQLDYPQKGNPFSDSNFRVIYQNPSVVTGPMLCATNYQQNPFLFQLPASNPYDNFLKAAGC